MNGDGASADTVPKLPAIDGKMSAPARRLPVSSIRQSSTSSGRASNTPKSVPKGANPAMGGCRFDPPKAAAEANGYESESGLGAFWGMYSASQSPSVSCQETPYPVAVGDATAQSVPIGRPSSVVESTAPPSFASAMIQPGPGIVVVWA